MGDTSSTTFNLREKDSGHQAGKLSATFVLFAGGGAFILGLVVYHDLTALTGSILSPLNLLVDGLAGFFVGAAFWVAWRLRGFAPDSARVDPDAIRLLRGSAVLHTLPWTDPRFSLILIDLSGDARANSFPRVALWSFKLRMSREFWPMTPEFMQAVLSAARNHGVPMSQTDARRFHFPDGVVYWLGTSGPSSG